MSDPAEPTAAEGSATPPPSSAETPRSPWGPLWPLGEAIRFLTILPTPGMPPLSEQGIARAIPYFPLAGALIGGLLAGAGALARPLWGPGVAAALIVVLWGILTAGLHLDGLSDTFDGVMSWRSRERKLEIMKDSRIGAMGAIALVAVLLLKLSFLGAAGERWWWAAWLAPVLGRWADCYGILMFPPASEGGLGRTFQAQAGRNDLWIATAITGVLCVLLGGALGLVALALVWLTTHIIGRWWVRDLGGLTGDTYGALCEIAEVVALAALAVRLS